MRRKLMILIAIFTLIAASCGSSTTEETSTQSIEAADAEGSREGSDAVETADADDDSGADETESASNNLEDYESPLFDLLGFDPSSFQDIDFEQYERDRQLLVQECMAEQGFEYTPNVVSEMVFFDDEVDEEWGTRAYAEKWGYGIATRFEDQIAYSTEAAAEFDSAQAQDPNQLYLDSLSVAERDAWMRAMNGESMFSEFDEETGQPLNPDTNEPFTEEEMDQFFLDFEPSGCQNAGYDDEFLFFGEGADVLENFDAEFGETLDGMEGLIDNDPRVAALDDNWVRCMNEKSYTFANRDAPYDAIFERMTPIEAAVFNMDMDFGMDPTAGMSDEEMEALTEDELDEMFSNFGPSSIEITPEVRKDLEAVQQYEISVAVADFDCSQDDFEIYNQVRIEVEERFIAENQGAIAAFLEANQG